MESLHIVIISILVFVLIFELFNSKSRVMCEAFSSAKTNIVWSNYDSSDSSDLYSKENEEILVLEQNPGKDRVMKFKNLRAPLGKYIAVYVRMEQDGGQVTVNSFLYQLETLNTNLIQLLGTNNLLITDQSKTIRYYIKLLNAQTYGIEKKKSDKQHATINRYLECIKLKKTTGSSNIAIAECKKEYKLN